MPGVRNTTTGVVQTSSGVAQTAAAIPSSELFEHNDLTGTYGGDTGSFNIQTGTVQEGTYALFGDGGGSSVAIVRDAGQNKWGPGVQGDIKISTKRYIPSIGGGGNGGTMFGCQSVSGHSSLSGYYMYVNQKNDQTDIRRIDSGSVTSLSSDGSSGITTDTWVDETIEWKTNGTINWTLDGNTVSATDTNYTTGYLGFFSYRDDYWDNIIFSKI
jgi:hypothetical protein